MARINNYNHVTTVDQSDTSNLAHLHNTTSHFRFLADFSCRKLLNIPDIYTEKISLRGKAFAEGDIPQTPLLNANLFRCIEVKNYKVSVDLILIFTT